MTPPETVLLTEYIRACCPQQAIGEYTPDAWHDLLGDLSLADCKAAVAAVAKRQPFVAPAEIRAEVKTIREQRLQDTAVPADLLVPFVDDPPAYLAAVRTAETAIADGRDPRAALQALTRQGRRELEAS
jgi:hypothetical protein